ncbi:MAG: DUF1294 domain-containing protein [Clostridia bacterium]|nr:DUF1294 domain-containing protein [Clostridia bacterium]
MRDILLWVFCAINLVGFLVALYDKIISRAPRGSIRRIPEKTFVTFAWLGGGIGVLFSMLLFRHKTKHGALLLRILLPTLLWCVVFLFFAYGAKE